ncbi:MAG TPA: hypothetical protein VGX37_07530 [Allosphingosinicella sp.]|jgi:hypothetical protein|nr:hypothetical protein [Allosphingosinicella sp.]
MFLIAGLLVGVQVLIGFLAGIFGDVGILAYFTAVALPFLVLGAFVTPGDWPREVAITMLAGATVCVGSFSIVLFLPDESGATLKLEAVPLSALSTGFVNLVLVFIAGLLLLFRRPFGPSR